jgi:hypothetical protein
MKTGEVFFITRPGPSLMGNPALHRDLSGNKLKNGFARYQVGAGIGGALVKNKTFFISTLNILLILKIILLCF